MATWKERLRPASFSGVAFKVRDMENAGGRRAAVHEYRLRDTPFVEDLGRAARRYSIEGYLIGDDAGVRAEELRAKLEASAPGRSVGRRLVHPVLGDLLVVCTAFRFRESSDENRAVRFSAEFVESGEELEPAPTIESAGASDQAATAVTEAGGQEFAEEVQVAGVVERARTAVLDVVHETVARLRRLDVFSGPVRDVDRLEAALTDLADEASSLVSAPADLAAAVLSSLDAVLDAASTPLGALDAYRALFEFPPVDDAGGGLQGEIATENGRLTAELVRVAAVAGAVRSAARADFVTLDDAQEVRAELGAELDLLEEEVGDDVLPTLEELRRVLGRSVPRAGLDLPSLRTVRLLATRPALAVAQELYQDAARAGEIVDRNLVRHPLRVPGAVPLLVLSS